MNLWHDLPIGEDAPATVNVVVEIPKGSQNKYEYDKDLELFKLDRVLFSPFHYPGDYGFMPQTLEEDGDPADAIVLINFPTYPGMIIEARPVGVLPMVDKGEPDSKILCVPVNDVRFAAVHKLSDVAQPILDEIGHFFLTYKQLEKKVVEIGEWQDVDKAREILVQAQERYKEKFAK